MQMIYKHLIVSGIILTLLDAIYIKINQTAFENQVVLIQRVIMQIKPIGVFMCYLFLILGLNYFIINKNRTALEAFMFGLVIYGVYDTTNYAMFKKWDPYLAMMDILWGGILMATTTHFTYLITLR